MLYNYYMYNNAYAILSPTPSASPKEFVKHLNSLQNVIKNCHQMSFIFSGRKDSEIMSSYLEQHSPVAPRMEGRIIIIGETGTAPSLRVHRIIIMLLFVIQWFIN